MKVLASRAVRSAGVPDAAGIARVHCLSHLETYRPIFGAEYSGPSEAQRRSHWHRRLELGDSAFVALAGDEIIGFIHATEEPGGQAEITTLYLLKIHHRRGVGHDLLTMLLNHLHSRGYAEAQLDCLQENKAAIAFYKSQGAHEIGRHGSNARAELRFSIRTRPFGL